MGGSHRESSRLSRYSWSPSRTSSRGGSPSSNGERCHSCFHSPALYRQSNEDYQEEQSSLDFVSAVAILRSLNELLETPSESHKICSFGQLRRMTNSPPRHISCQLVAPWWISSWILMTGFSFLLVCVRRFRSCFSIWGQQLAFVNSLKGRM